MKRWIGYEKDYGCSEGFAISCMAKELEIFVEGREEWLVLMFWPPPVWESPGYIKHISPTNITLI